jgi:hypothetical protein
VVESNWLVVGRENAEHTLAVSSGRMAPCGNLVCGAVARSGNRLPFDGRHKRLCTSDDSELADCWYRSLGLSVDGRELCLLLVGGKEPFLQVAIREVEVEVAHHAGDALGEGVVVSAFGWV